MSILNTEQLKSKFDKGESVLLLDVRGDEYFREEHILGAKSIPASSIVDKIACCVEKDKEIITYCTNSNCTLSEAVATNLESLGYSHVYRYIDGLQGWKAAGLEVAKGEVE